MHFFNFYERIYLSRVTGQGVKMSYIQIDSTKCKSCYLCVDVCPKKLITKDGVIGKTGENTAKFSDTKECIACAQCAMVCPDLAIVSVVKE